MAFQGVLLFWRSVYESSLFGVGVLRFGASCGSECAMSGDMFSEKHDCYSAADGSFTLICY